MAPPPNARLSQSKGFRDWTSEKVFTKKSVQEVERDTVSMPVTKEEMKNKATKCTCDYEIDSDIIEQCSSFEDCTVCQKVRREFEKQKSSRISSGNSRNKRETQPKSTSSSIHFNCKSYEKCKTCAQLFRDAPHQPLCKSLSQLCVECEEFKDEIREKLLSDKMTIKSSFVDSCSSFTKCKDCQIAKELKKLHANKSKNIKVTHKNCLDNFCIPCE